ncbi:RPG1 [Auxenochlorella protothecoides x Auxenochlorella symbiontica]
MGYDEGDSVTSFPSESVLSWAESQRRQCRQAPATVTRDAWLSQREELVHARRKAHEWECKARDLSAQLARVEEAAKRALVGNDRSLRGGLAQRLLDAESALARQRSEHADAAQLAHKYRRSAAEAAKQNAELKSRLAAAKADQRALALQVGKLQAKTLGQKQLRGRVGQAGRSQVPQAEPQSLKGLSLVKRLVEQQEQLAAQREEILSLLHAARRAPLRAWHQHQSLVTSLEACILYAYTPRRLGAAAELQRQHGCIWVLQEWQEGSAVYLRDPVTNFVYSLEDWPQPVGRLTGGVPALQACPPRAALAAVIAALGDMSGSSSPSTDGSHDADDPRAGRGSPMRMLERGDSELLDLLLHPYPRALGLPTRQILAQAAKLATSQPGFHGVAQLRRAIETVVSAGRRRGKALVAPVLRVGSSYRDLLSWMRDMAPSLDRTELCYLLLAAKCWDMDSSGHLSSAAMLCALQCGATWRIKAQAAGSVAHTSSLQSLTSAALLEAKLETDAGGQTPRGGTTCSSSGHDLVSDQGGPGTSQPEIATECIRREEGVEGDARSPLQPLEGLQTEPRPRQRPASGSSTHEEFATPPTAILLKR